MQLYNLKLTLDDSTEVDQTLKVSFAGAKDAVQEMMEEGFFTMQPSGSNVLMIPFRRVDQIEIVPE